MLYHELSPRQPTAISASQGGEAKGGGMMRLTTKKEKKKKRIDAGQGKTEQQASFCIRLAWILTYHCSCGTYEYPLRHPSEAPIG